MLKVFTISLITVVILATYVQSKCYECNSDVGGDCGHNFNKETALEVKCGNSVGVSAVSVSVPGSTQHFTSVKNATGCLKAVVGDFFGNKHTIRTCYYGDFYNSAPECSALGPRFGFTETMSCDICNSDLCNGSHTTLPLSGLFGFITVVFLNLCF